MSASKAKGRVGENRVAAFMGAVWPGVTRTGSNHSTEWGACDLRNTRQWGVEVKRWANEFSAVNQANWDQALRNAGYADKLPMLISLRHGRNVKDALVVCTLEDMRELLRKVQGQ